MTQAFYKPEPTPPDKSQVARALRWSLRLSVAGWIVYGLFAFAFADVNIISARVQSAFVLLGSALIIAGGEANTIPTGIAALSKLGTDRFSAVDAMAFIASFGGSLLSGLITFSTRQVELAGTPWRRFAVVQGPLYIGVAYTLDLYGALAELALAKRDYERNWAQWWEEKLAWESEHGAPRQSEPQFDPSWPVARIEDWRRATTGMNGGTPQTVRGLARVLAGEELNMPAQSTVKRWLRLGREE